MFERAVSDELEVQILTPPPLNEILVVTAPIVTKLATQGCQYNNMLSRPYQSCWNKLVTNLIVPSIKLTTGYYRQCEHNLSRACEQTCYNWCVLTKNKSLKLLLQTYIKLNTLLYEGRYYYFKITFDLCSSNYSRLTT